MTFPDTTFTTGTTITSNWLNAVNDAIVDGAANINYTPPFTGSVTTTVGNKLSETVSVKDFGAVGDGVTDDTAAFNDAADAVTSGGQVLIPAGTYLLSADINKNCTWVFDGLAKITGGYTLTPKPTGSVPSARVFKISNSESQWSKGTLIGSMNDWPSTDIAATLRDNTQLMVVSNNGVYAQANFVRSSDWDSAPAFAEGAVGFAAFALNDKTDVQVTTYGCYTDATRNSGTGTTLCWESDSVNFGTTTNPWPYNSIPWGSTINLWIAAGGARTGVNNSSAAIGIKNNGAKFMKGIVFDRESIYGNDGFTGYGVAIDLARGHQINWNEGTNGNVTGIITSEAANGASQQTLAFTSDGLTIFDRNQSPRLAVFNAKNKAQLAVGSANLSNLTAAFFDGTTVFIRQIGIGAADSGGAGYRMLRIAN